VELDPRGRRLRAALAAVLLASASASAAEIKRSMLCESREAAIVGYYNNEPGRPEGAVKRSTALERQDQLAEAHRPVAVWDGSTNHALQRHVPADRGAGGVDLRE
jgi:hypothetical protein